MLKKIVVFLYFTIWVLVMLPVTLSGLIILSPLLCIMFYINIKYFGGGQGLKFLMDYRNYNKLKDYLRDDQRWAVILARFIYIIMVIIALPLIIIGVIISIPLFFSKKNTDGNNIYIK